MSENDGDRNTRWEQEFRIWQAEDEQRFRTWKEENEKFVRGQLAMFEAVTAFAVLALKGVILVNGGAAVALLAFLGHIWGSGDAARQVAVAVAAGGSLHWFIGGTFAGVTAAGVSYLAQVLFSEVSPWSGHTGRVIAVILGAVGLACFAMGAQEAVEAFTIKLK